MNSLLACPFCGQKAGQLEAKMVFPTIGFRIICGCCNIRINWWHTEQQAVDKWNTRATVRSAATTHAMDILFPVPTGERNADDMGLPAPTFETGESK